MSLPDPDRLGSYETFDHTADVGMRVRADSLDVLFATAARAVFAYVVANLDDVRPELTETVELAADSIESLLRDWLNELVYRSETQHRVYCRFDVRVNAEPPQLAASITGALFDADRHVADHEVKAVTHHGLKVERDGDAWLAEVILDI